MTLLTKILIGIAVACFLFIIPVVVIAVKKARRTDRQIDAMKRLLNTSGNSIHDALEEMARQALMHVHYLSIKTALDLRIPVLFVAYDDNPPKAEYIGHIDGEYNVLLYDNVALEGDYIDSVTLNEYDLSAIFTVIKGSLSLCAAEAKRRQEEDGTPSDLEYMREWVKTNVLTAAK